MGELFVTKDGNGVSKLSFEERLEQLDNAKEKQRMKGPFGRFARFSQKNLDRTMEIVSLWQASSAARVILDIFEDVMDKSNGGVIVSNKTLSLILGVSEPTVSRALKTLRDRGFVTVLKTGRENVYTVNDTVFWKNSAAKIWTSKFPVNVLLSMGEQEPEVRKELEDAIRKLESGEMK